MGAGDRVVSFDVAILRRHPDIDPGAPRGLAVTLERTREPHVVRRVDPDSNRVCVAERAVKGADAFHDDDARRLDASCAAALAGCPVVRGELRRLTVRERSDEFTSDPSDFELRAVPELVGRHDLST